MDNVDQVQNDERAHDGQRAMRCDADRLIHRADERCLRLFPPATDSLCILAEDGIDRASWQRLRSAARQWCRPRHERRTRRANRHSQSGLSPLRPSAKQNIAGDEADDQSRHRA